HYDLGVLYARAGRHEEAARAFRAATQLSPGNVALRHDLARELAAAGHPAEAIAELQALRAAGAPHVAVSLNLAQLLRTQGLTEEAAAVYQQVATEAPRQAWEGLAAARLDQGRFAEAREATARLLALPVSETERQAQRRRLEVCDLLLAVETRLPDILAG